MVCLVSAHVIVIVKLLGLKIILLSIVLFYLLLLIQEYTNLFFVKHFRFDKAPSKKDDHFAESAGFKKFQNFIEMTSSKERKDTRKQEGTIIYFTKHKFDEAKLENQKLLSRD